MFYSSAINVTTILLANQRRTVPINWLGRVNRWLCV